VTVLLPQRFADRPGHSGPRPSKMGKTEANRTAIQPIFVAFEGRSMLSL
jgi:hypothetical protein